MIDRPVSIYQFTMVRFKYPPFSFWIYFQSCFLAVETRISVRTYIYQIQVDKGTVVNLIFELSRRFINFKKMRLRSKLSLGLIYGLSFRFKAASFIPSSWVQKPGVIFCLVDFHGRNWRIPGFSENKTQSILSLILH